MKNILILFGVFALAACVHSPSALDSYVQLPDTHFSWKLISKTKSPGGTIHSLEMDSQEWHGTIWKHSLIVFEPESIHFQNQALLFITSGSNPLGKFSSEPEAMKLANLIGAPLIYLHQVPNQPLLDGKKEDELIAETFSKYLTSNDSTWPLLFPMVKSAVRAIDALQEYGKKAWNRNINEIVVTGISKRGWTAWLTAVADPRVIAIAPMAIDSLNFAKQMEHQAKTWGHYSEEIDDYSKKGLVETEKNRDAMRIWRECDPYSFKERLKIPKLLINATNDAYWTVDALNVYWDDLVGKKWIHYLPNNPHSSGIINVSANGILAAFFRASASHRALPSLNWSYEESAKQLHLKMVSLPKPTHVVVWSAHSNSKDFHSSTWVQTAIKPSPEGNFDAVIERPAGDHLAVFGEFTYSEGATPYTLSTQMHVE